MLKILPTSPNYGSNIIKVHLTHTDNRYCSLKSGYLGVYVLERLQVVTDTLPQSLLDMELMGESWMRS